MAIDLDRCVGCQSCVVACKVENNVPFSSPKESAEGREIAWIHVVSTVEGEFPDLRDRHVPILCMHCDEPPCVPVCPTGATYKSEATGIVGQIYPRCIGCRFCTVACPYTVKYFNWYTPEWPEEMGSRLPPDVSVRERGLVEKCTFCSHRLEIARDRVKAENRPLREGDYTTACQDACPTQAIVFGDLDDPGSRVSGMSKSTRAYRYQEELGTHPKVYYLTKGEWHVPSRD
jgi:Fe-S-cluster-containing dehydrogenase component